ncbi:MAG: DUF4331 family protein [Acidimicrobiales bacterium]
MRKRRFVLGVGLAVSALTMAVATAPNLGNAADHFDAPGSFISPSNRNDADIADVYAFRSPQVSGRSVLAITTHPALGVVTTDPTYGTDLLYKIHVGPNLTYTLQFFRQIAPGVQPYVVYRTDGLRIARIGQGQTNTTASIEGGRAFAGKVSDPFFFDLVAFNNTVQARLDQRILPLNLHGETGRQVCATTTGIDTFANFNSNAIVLEVPNSSLGSGGGVWANTVKGGSVGGGGAQIDRMGRPAINTVFNGFKKLLDEGNEQDKNLFNAIVNPANDATSLTADGHTFRDNVLLVLSRFDGVAQSLAGIPPRSAATLNAIAGILLPDVLPFNPANPTTDGITNGRALADDVIDNELPIVTNGLVTTDCVGPHNDYRSTFPFLGAPH